MTRIAFLVAAGESVGSGHATRCLFLAHAFHDWGCEVTFRLNDPPLLDDLGFETPFAVRSAVATVTIWRSSASTSRT